MKRLLAAALFAPAVALGALPLGTATFGAAGSGSCGAAVTLATNACVLATVDVPNGTLDGASTAVDTKTASVKVTTQTGALTGTIVLLTGGSGSSWYENQYSGAVAGFLNAALARGQRVIQINWTGGWDTGSVGSRTLANRAATLLKAIHDDAAYYTAGTPFIVIGHSSGASLLAYTLAHYGGGDWIDLAVFTSGPPHARVDYGCFGTAIAAWASAGPALCTTGNVITYDSSEQALIETTYNSRTACSAKAINGGVDNAGERDSIVRGDATLHYPQTAVRAVYGDADGTAATPLGRHYFSLISAAAKAENITTGSVNHNGVPGSASGAAFIDTALSAATFRH